MKFSSSNINQGMKPINATKYDDLENGFSSEGENAFICFNFNSYKVIPKSYTIRSWNSNSGASHPRGWVIEGSNDNYEFEILDEQRNCSLLNGNSLVCTFNINNPQNKKYQYLRMRSIMHDWINTNSLDINSIDFIDRSGKIHYFY